MAGTKLVLRQSLEKGMLVRRRFLHPVITRCYNSESYMTATHLLHTQHCMSKSLSIRVKQSSCHGSYNRLLSSFMSPPLISTSNNKDRLLSKAKSYKNIHPAQTSESTFPREVILKRHKYSTTPRRVKSWTKHVWENPLDSLQPLLQVPVLSKAEHLFRPTVENVKEGEQFFCPDKHGVQWLGHVTDLTDLPEAELPEVAFLGRSNVGKSSLIKCLLPQNVSTQLNIRISKKPGATKSLHFFKVGKNFTLIDMPGYGHNMPDHFVQSVEGYINQRRNLCRVFLLIDASISLSATDKLGIQMLEELKRPYVLVLTKIDKASKHKVLRNMWTLLEYCRQNTHCCFPQPFLISSLTGDGLAFLQCFVTYVTGLVQVSDVVDSEGLHRVTPSGKK